GGVQGVGTGLQVNPHGYGSTTVVDRSKVVVLGSQLNAGNILQAQGGTLLVTAQDHFAEFFRACQPAGRRHTEGEGLAFRGRFGTDTAGGKLGVLAAQGVGHITGGQFVLGQLVGPQPDSHGIVLGTKQRGITNTRQAHQLVQHVEQGIVGDFHHIHGVVRRRQGNHLQDGGRAGFHLQALVPHRLGQPCQCLLHPVVDVDGGLVRIGADFKRHGYPEAAGVGGAGFQVDHVVYAVDLLLQWGHHGIGDNIGTGAGEAAAVDHRGRHQVGVLFHRQAKQCPGTTQGNNNGVDRRENRAVYEGASHQSVPSPSSALVTFTCAPSRRLVRPLTIKRSPASSPSSKICRPWETGPSSTTLARALPSSSTTYTTGPCGPWATAFSGTVMMSSNDCNSTLTRTNWPGTTICSGF